MSSNPFQLIAAPFQVYLAPVGEAFPAIDATPAGNWAVLGSNKDYSEDGVTVSSTQEITTFRGLGSVADRAAFREGQSLMFGFTVHDVTADVYSKALNGAAIVATAAGAGTAGHKSMEMLLPPSVDCYAVLIRGAVSPEGVGASGPWNTQFEVAMAYQAADVEPVFKKGEPAGLAFEFTALVGDADEFATFRYQDADPV